MDEIHEDSVGKKITLSPGRVVLGRAPVRAASLPLVEEAQPVAAEPHPLEIALNERERRIAALEAELALARSASASARDEVETLRADIEAAREQAVRAGLAEGRAEGAQAAENEMREQAALWQQGMNDLAVQQRAFCTRVTDSLADLVLACTVRIIGERLVNVEQARAALEYLISQSGLDGPLTVRVAPAFYDALQNSTAEDGRWRYQSDARVEYGGALLECDGVVVDGRYERQLARLRDIVADLGSFDPS